MIELLIRGARVADGRGGEPFRADVGVDQGRVAFVGIDPSLVARRRIEADRMIVCPGFIDVHSHSDLAILQDPSALPKTRQGITTEIVGNCGWGPAPISASGSAAWRVAAAPVLGERDDDATWSSFGAYLERVRAARPGINVLALVPHGAVRHSVRGMDPGPSSGQHLDQMRGLVAEAIRDGAVGLSAGLVYPPGVYADTAELVELAREAGRADRLMALHLRNYGRRLLDGVDEAIGIARQADVRLQISHLSIIGQANDHLLPAALERIESARAGGVDVMFDQQPYEGACSILSLLLPAWVTEGGIQATSRRLSSPAERKRLSDHWAGTDGRDPWWENYVGHIGWGNILIAGTSDLVPDDTELVGRTFEQAADLRGRAPSDVAMDLWVAHRGAVTIVLVGLFSRETVERIFKHPLSMVATDAVVVDGLPHPRLYGTYPRVLGEFVRERGLETWGRAVAKMSALPADRFGIRARGVLETGAAADIVVFDPTSIRDNADYLHPTRFPTGIQQVLVNGVPAGSVGAGSVAHPGALLADSGG